MPKVRDWLIKMFSIMEYPLPSLIPKSVYSCILIVIVTSRLQDETLHNVASFCICNANTHRKLPARHTLNDLLYVVVYKFLSNSYLYFQLLFLVFTMNTYCF